jgi:hypothetical protein
MSEEVLAGGGSGGEGVGGALDLRNFKVIPTKEVKICDCKDSEIYTPWGQLEPYCKTCNRKIYKLGGNRPIMGFARGAATGPSFTIRPSNGKLVEVKTTKVKFIENWNDNDLTRLFGCYSCGQQFICLDVGYDFCPWCGLKIDWE